MSSQESPGKQRYAQLDGLRGLAAGAVVFFHYFGIFPDVFETEHAPIPHAQLGRFGVQLFFIISGFVIFMTLARVEHPRDFVATRLIRLYPSYWATILLTSSVIATGVFRDTDVTQHTLALKQVVANATMLQAFLNVPHLDGTYWTLAHELSFYTWAFIMLLALDRERVERYAAAYLVLNAALAYTLGHELIHIGLRLRTLLLVDYGQFFVAGIMFYRLRTAGPSPLRHALIAGAFLSQAIRGDHESSAAMLGFFAVFYALHFGKLQWLRARPLTWLGSISYALYLTHQIPGWALALTLRRHAVPYWPALFITLACTLTLAWAITTFVERPAMLALKSKLLAEPTRRPAIS